METHDGVVTCGGCAHPQPVRCCLAPRGAYATCPEARSVAVAGADCGVGCVRSRAAVEALEAATAAAAKLAARSAALPPLLALAHERLEVWLCPP